VKERFGLVVSEALWKAKPVVAGDVGGIPMQVPTAHHRFLTDSINDCAAKIATLIDDADTRKDSAKPGAVMSVNVSCCRASSATICASCTTWSLAARKP
jgi:glycosyltransferase involved in cell wall biosynthesis